MNSEKKILDVTCGSKTIWFNKNHPNAMCANRVLHQRTNFTPKTTTRTTRMRKKPGTGGLNMSDYIGREAFIADCEGRYCAPCKEQGKDSNGMKCRACWVDDMLGEVMDAPAADVEPVRRGRWEGVPNAFVSVASKDGSYHGNATTCSACHEVNPNAYKTNFCPICGAKMDLEDENDE